VSKFLTISELSKKINLINTSTKRPLNHILRYWEKEFKQIRPKKINNRRYYSEKQVEIVRLIKFLLKSKGMTVSGVKNILDTNINKLDDYNLHSLKAQYYKTNLKEKSKSILNRIKKIKNYGKKNTS
tara:strand:+ start:195 stop:575 length:381 start_codon:yes stop_codon:yes gene_type:complete